LGQPEAGAGDAQIPGGHRRLNRYLRGRDGYHLRGRGGRHLRGRRRPCVGLAIECERQLWRVGAGIGCVAESFRAGRR
jgi:hypothetical protein